MCGLSEFKYQRDEGKDLVSIKPEHMSFAFCAAWDERKITMAAMEGGGLGFLCRSPKQEKLSLMDGRSFHSLHTGSEPQSNPLGSWPTWWRRAISQGQTICWLIFSPTERVPYSFHRHPVTCQNLVRRGDHSSPTHPLCVDDVQWDPSPPQTPK